MFTQRTRWFQTLALFCAIAIGSDADGRLASAQPAEPPPLAPEMIGEMGGATTAVVAGADGIYAAVGARIRVLEPGERPAVLAESALLPGRVHDMIEFGDALLVAAGPAGLIVLDLAEPASLARIGRVPVSGAGEMLVDLALVGAESDRPRLAGTFVDPYAGTSRVQVFDVGEGGDLQARSSLPVEGVASGMVEWNGHLLLAVSDAGILRIGIDPETAAMDLEGQLDGPYTDVAVAGDRIFASRDRAIDEVDWTTPTAPRRGGEIRLTSRTVHGLHGEPNRLCAVGSFDGQGPGYWCYDPAGPLDPEPELGHTIRPEGRRHPSPRLGGVATLALVDDHAYLALSAEGLMRVSLADPAVGMVEHAAFPASGDRLEIMGDLAITAGRGSGLEIWDIGRPGDPRFLWGRAEAEVSEMAIAPPWLYTLEEGQLVIRDLSQADAPIEPPPIALAIGTSTLRVDAGRLSLLEPRSDASGMPARTLLVFDLEEPGNLRPLGRMPLEGIVRHVALEGDRFWYSDDASQQIVEIGLSDPSRPVEIGRHGVDFAVWDLQVSDGLLAALGRDAIRLFDASEAGRMRGTAAPLTRSMGAMALDAGRLAVASSRDGLTLFDVSRADRPLEVARWSEPDPPAMWVAIHGGRVAGIFGIASAAIVTVLDLAEPVASSREQLFPASWHEPGDIAIDAARAYVADRLGSAWLVDLHDRARPAVRARAGSNRGARRPQVQTLDDDRLVVAPFTTYDVSDPSRPRQGFQYLAGVTHALGTQDVFLVRDGIAFVAWHRQSQLGRGSEMLDVFDIEAPIPIQPLGQLVLGHPAIDMAARGDALYVAGPESLQAVDVSDPSNPTIAAEIGGDFRALAVRGPRLWTLTNWAMHVYALEEPTRPRLVASLTLPTPLPEGYLGRLAVSTYGLRTYGLVPFGERGLLLVDLTEDQPRAIGRWQAGWAVAEAHLAGRHATVLLEQGGLLTMDLELDAGPIADQIYLPLVPRRR